MSSRTDCPQPPSVPVPVSDHLHCEKIFLVSSQELPALQLVPVTFPPSTLLLWEESGSIFFTPFHEAAAGSSKVSPLFSYIDKQIQFLEEAGRRAESNPPATLSCAISSTNSKPIMLSVGKQHLVASTLFTEAGLLVSPLCKLIVSYNRRKRPLNLWSVSYSKGNSPQTDITESWLAFPSNGK